MATYTKPLDLYKAQKAYFDRMALDMKDAHAELAASGLDDAKELTAGRLSRFQTRGAYARGSSRRRALSPSQLKARGLPGRVPLLPVNIQSGKLHNSFRLVPKASGAGQLFDLTQEDPGGGIYRIKPGGTYKMVDSGFFKEIERRWKARNKAFVDHYREVSSRSI